MSILKKLKSLAPALSAVVVAACIGVSLHGYSTPVYAVDIPETTKNQTDEDASEQENADTAEKEKKEDITLDNAVKMAQSLVNEGLSINAAAKDIAASTPFKKSDIYKALL